jgi:hypothetical protein
MIIICFCYDDREKRGKISMKPLENAEYIFLNFELKDAPPPAHFSPFKYKLTWHFGWW